MSLIEHKKARLNYEILEEFEAGLELLGGEVKSLRAGHGKLEGSYVVVRGGDAWVVGGCFGVGEGGGEVWWGGPSPPPNHPPNTPKGSAAERTRRLLLNKKEL